MALDRASPRITTAVAGRTPEGRPLRWALVGDPRALTPTAVRAASAAARAVRAGATGPRAVARVARRPALVWIGAGVHANEPSGTTAALALLSRLSSGEDCGTRRILHGTTTVVVPDQNPDGRARRTRTNAADVDLNRDWFAASQPETRARLAVLRRLPPTVAVDAHEQTGTGYFAPPYARPVVAGLPRAARGIADGLVRRAVDRALLARGVRTTHHAGYDLLYPGYADSATSLLFGAGGMTYEQGSDLPLAEKTRRHATALRATLAAVADHRTTVVRAWARGFADAVAAGRAGRDAAGGRAYGWTLRTDAHAADAWTLAARLRADGVRVRSLRAATRVRIDPLGPAGPHAAVLPAGTLVVPADQPLGRWAGALLGRDADEAGAAAGDADTWSMPRLAGLRADVLLRRVPAGRLTTEGARRPVAVGAGRTVAFAGDSAAADRLALGLLAAGLPVARTPGGTLRATVDPAGARQAAHAGVALRPAGGAPGDGARAVPTPRVALLPDPTPAMTGTPARLPVRDRPAGWVTGALRAAGVVTYELAPATLEDGVPTGTTHLLLGPGDVPGGVLTPRAAAAVAAFARRGGTVLALGTEGIATAREAGITRVETVDPPSSQGVSIVARAGDDPVGAALAGDVSVVVAGEPRLTAPAGAAVPLRAAAGARLAPSGPVAAADGLAGRPLVVDEAAGAGHVLSVGLSPAFRRQSDGGERVLLGLLLATR
nr:M14 family zinc carboxypeptidase [Patulibacter sp. SYSU D01012]